LNLDELDALVASVDAGAISATDRTALDPATACLIAVALEEHGGYELDERLIETFDTLGEIVAVHEVRTAQTAGAPPDVPLEDPGVVTVGAGSSHRGRRRSRRAR
jgi:hypothetical protein